MRSRKFIYWLIFCTTFSMAADFDSFVESTLNQVASDQTIDVDVFNKKNWKFRKETFSDQQAAKFWFVFLQKEDALTTPFLAQEVEKRGRKVQVIEGIPAPSKISGQVYAISAMMRFLKPNQVKPTKMGFDFPGAVSSSERFNAIRAKEVAFAKKLSRRKDPKIDIFLKPQRYLSTKPKKRKLLVNCARSRWFTTGVYADPGELLQFKFPASMVNSGFKVRIGANKDDIRKREQWVRWPLVTIEREVDQANFKIANPNGGIVYIIIPDSADPRMKTTVGMMGGNRMPHFYLGRMNPKLWAKIKNVKAPWAELEMKDLVITLQSKMLAQIENPVELLKYWQKVAELQDELSTRKTPRYKERFVVDRQISAGYLHAGYPIMGPMNCEVEDALVNMERLKKDGHWGWFHELGHNHQRSPWRSIWPDMVEVSVNYFSMYTTEIMCNKPPEEVGWIRRRVEKAKVDYSGLKADTSARMSSSGEIDKSIKGDYFGAALTMFMHLRKQFGWDLFQEAFRQYEEMGKESWPNTSQGRADLWVKMTSEISKRDLVAYYESWGYPVSESVKSEIKKKRLRPYEIGLWPEKTTPIKIERKRRKK